MVKTTHWNIAPIEGMGVQMRGVIHVGAHYGQEYCDYVNNGIKHVIFIEPLKDNYDKLVRYHEFPDTVTTLNMAIGNFNGEVDMNVETANLGMSSSILEPGSHLMSYPKITFDKKERVPIRRLDDLAVNRSLYNVLVVDVQGYELEVFKGAVETLKGIDIIFTEVNTGEVYKGCAKLPELDAFLGKGGFRRHHCHVYKGLDYGDAIYIRDGR